MKRHYVFTRCHLLDGPEQTAGGRGVGRGYGEISEADSRRAELPRGADGEKPAGGGGADLRRGVESPVPEQEGAGRLPGASAAHRVRREGLQAELFEGRCLRLRVGRARAGQCGCCPLNTLKDAKVSEGRGNLPLAVSPHLLSRRFAYLAGKLLESD